MKQYQQKLDKYNQKLHAYGDGVVDSRSVIQKLTIESDPNSKLSISNVNGPISYGYQEKQNLNGKENAGPGYAMGINENKKGIQASFDATWTNLSKISYQGKKITKIVMHFVLTQYEVNDSRYVLISQNFYNGFVLNDYSANVTMSMYYDNGEKVTFEDGTAYLAVASLNTYKDKVRWAHESTQVVSGGRALALYGSSVSLHNGNTLYSDKANSNDATGKDRAVLGGWNYQPGDLYPNEAELTNSNIPDNWDTYDSPYRYYGAGLITLIGNETKFNVSVKYDDMLSESKPWLGQWFNMGTVIPETPDINRPQPPQISYHLDSSLLCALFLVLFVFKLYFQFCNIIINFYYC